MSVEEVRERGKTSNLYASEAGMLRIIKGELSVDMDKTWENSHIFLHVKETAPQTLSSKLAWEESGGEKRET